MAFRRLAGAAWLAACTVAAPALGGAVDRIVAVVDGHPILASEVQRRAALHEQSLNATTSSQWRSSALRRQIRWRVLERLVEERLIEQAARRAGVTADDADVDAALQSIATERGMAVAELTAAVHASGWKLADYRHALRTQLLRWRLRELVKRERGGERTDDEWTEVWKRWLAELRSEAHIELHWQR